MIGKFKLQILQNKKLFCQFVNLWQLVDSRHYARNQEIDKSELSCVVYPEVCWTVYCMECLEWIIWVSLF